MDVTTEMLNETGRGRNTNDEVGMMSSARLGLSALLNASFAGRLPAPGGIGYLSQSGALLASVLEMARGKHLHFNFLISMGNKADVDELELMKLLGEDPDTRVIAGYLETMLMKRRPTSSRRNCTGR